MTTFFAPVFYPDRYFLPDYFGEASDVVITNNYKTILLKVNSQVEEILSINIQSDISLGVNTQLEFTVER